jgi:phthiocerol/phenolphthiocerol synthesis type-I polyketide synthase D
METLPPAILEHQLTSHADSRSLERYRLRPYGGRIVLYRSTEPTPWTVQDDRYALDDTNGFGVACPKLEIIPIPGTHHMNLLDPPGVQVIADHLGPQLG